MPAELLVKAEAPNRGAIVNVRPANWQWGGAEALPNFVRVSITDGTYKAARAWATGWQRDVKMAVDAATATEATLTFSGDPVRQSDAMGALTAAEIQNEIDEWGMVLTNEAVNAITCTIGIFQAAVSIGFWGIDISAAQATDLGVVDGWQRVELNYSATGRDANVVGQRIAQRRCEVLSNDGAIVRFAVPVAEMADALREDLREYNKTIASQRYLIAESAVDSAVSNGGAISATEQQVLNNLIDRITA